MQALSAYEAHWGIGGLDRGRPMKWVLDLL
jgi:hypothetical protein